MLQNQDFIQNLIEVREHYQSNIEDAERDSIHATEQLNHINALLVDGLAENQQFTQSLLQLRKHYQVLRSQHYQKVQSAKEQIAHINALLADSLVLQHTQQQPISIQSASLEQQALMGAMPSAERIATIADKDGELQRQSPEVAREQKPPDISEQQIASDISQKEHDKAMPRADTRNALIATPTEESPQQNLEVAESPQSPQVSEPQILTDFHQRQQDEEQPSLPEPEPINAVEAQISTDSYQVDPQPELEPPTELPDVEDSPNDSEQSLTDKPVPSASSRKAAPLKTPLLPQYQHLTKSSAIKQLLPEHWGVVC